MEPVIQVENLRFFYENTETTEKREVIRGVNLTVNRGEFLAVLGHNGSGKSTLAKHMNAILTPSSGRVLVEGIDTADGSRLYEIRQKVGMVFQNPDNQLVATVVEEDVAFAPENLGVPPEEIRLRVEEALKAVNMYEFLHHAPHMLSGGQKQRIAIAGVLAMQPDIIVMDEPTAMLDPSGRKEIMQTVRRLNREHGMTVVLITHYMDEAAQADRIAVMNNGEFVMQGTPREVFRQVEKVKSFGLDVPQTAELAYRLRQHGLELSQDILTVEECAAELAACWRKRGAAQ